MQVSRLKIPAVAMLDKDTRAVAGKRRGQYSGPRTVWLVKQSTDYSECERVHWGTFKMPPMFRARFKRSLFCAVKNCILCIRADTQARMNRYKNNAKEIRRSSGDSLRIDRNCVGASFKLGFLKKIKRGTEMQISLVIRCHL